MISLYTTPQAKNCIQQTLCPEHHRLPFGEKSITFQQEIESYVASLVTALHASTCSHRVQQYQSAQEVGSVCSSLTQYYTEG